MKALLAVVFVVIVTLPLAGNLAGLDGADPQEENREFAPFPRLDASWPSIRAFGDGLSAWFEDHFAFRAALVRASAETRLFGLGVSPTPAVVKGRDGWFFYGEDASIEDYTRQDPLTPEALANWRSAVSRAHDWLQRRGIAYVFWIAPDKYVLYPEEMPASLARIGPISHTDQLYATLEHTSVPTVDVRTALFAEKERQRVYQQTDTHWNERGVLVAYQMIVDAIRAQVPAVPPAWGRSDFEPVVREIPGMDLAGMMGLRKAMRETDLALMPKRPRLARVIEPAGAEPIAEEGRLVTEIPGSTLPRAVIFRDSFVSRLVPFLSEHFSRAVYLWQNDFDAEAIRKEHPDVVIQEIVGRHLYNFIPSPELVPDE